MHPTIDAICIYDLITLDTYLAKSSVFTVPSCVASQRLFLKQNYDVKSCSQ